MQGKDPYIIDIQKQTRVPLDLARRVHACKVNSASIYTFLRVIVFPFPRLFTFAGGIAILAESLFPNLVLYRPNTVDL